MAWDQSSEEDKCNKKTKFEWASKNLSTTKKMCDY